MVASAFAHVSRDTLADYRHGMRLLLERLAGHAGATWQERWESAGLNDAGRTVMDLADATKTRSRLRAAAGLAFCLRLIQPSLAAMRATNPAQYVDKFVRTARDPLLEQFRDRVARHPIAADLRHRAMLHICRALTVYGVDLAGLTAGALVKYVEDHPGSGIAGAWPVLHEMGHLPTWLPRTLQDARIRGRLTVDELVDRLEVRNQEVRNLLVDYIRRRAVEVDYGTMENLVRNLVQNFWKIVEEVSPGQTDLRLSEETVQEWKQRLMVRQDGKPRQHIDGPFLGVRAFYLDLQTWSAAEPERWARWVAPSPIRDADLRWFHIRRRRLRERMADRTRERQPLLAILSQHVTDEWQRLRALLDAARPVPLGDQFVVDGVRWQRAANKRTLRRPELLATEPVQIINLDTGELVRVSHQENDAFWQWAVIETLRLAGLRREELVELTHLSIRQYQRPNGEVVALLVVSPSKSDRERVIPMSAELFHVIAQIVRRHRQEYGTVPVSVRYDQLERTWCEPLPYLLQRLQSGTPRALSVTGVREVVRKAARALIPSHPQFADIRFSPHDFRRLFATELVNNGLPIHIGAALLGHLNVQTTRGYVAVFEEDVVAHYQDFLERRRAQRPDGEYRKPTADEWADFQDHFDKRRVELGSCGRPYGTPCAHEHVPLTEMAPAFQQTPLRSAESDAGPLTGTRVLLAGDCAWPPSSAVISRSSSSRASGGMDGRAWFDVQGCRSVEGRQGRPRGGDRRSVPAVSSSGRSRPRGGCGQRVPAPHARGRRQSCIAAVLRVRTAGVVPVPARGRHRLACRRSSRGSGLRPVAEDQQEATAAAAARHACRRLGEPGDRQGNIRRELRGPNSEACPCRDSVVLRVPPGDARPAAGQPVPQEQERRGRPSQRPPQSDAAVPAPVAASDVPAQGTQAGAAEHPRSGVQRPVRGLVLQ
ncbi:site-specific integrase [Actinoplanes regularis]|uniref:site-specific integrase n=1 Tax=Actinoplanes regularis TaxID=52697 RepID=UPI002557AEA3|nr:site-specific integrase [Actinoplanes regularis]